MVLSRIERTAFLISLVLLSSHGITAYTTIDTDVASKTIDGRTKHETKIRRIRRLTTSEDELDARMTSLYGVHKPPIDADSLWPYMGKQLRQSDKAILQAKTQAATPGGRPKVSSLNYSFDSFERSAVLWRGVGEVMSMDPGGGGGGNGGDMPSEAPARVVPSEAPAGVVPSEAPAGVVPSEAPAGDIASEAPAGDIASEPPAEDIASEPPAEVIASEPPSEDAAASEPPSGDIAPAGDAQPGTLNPNSTPTPTISPVSGRDPLPTPGPITTLSPTTAQDNMAPPTNGVVKDPDQDDGSNKRLILGASLGAVAGVSVLACCAVLICQWRKRNPPGPPDPVPA